MTAPRRRLLRPAATSTAEAQAQRETARLLARLEVERIAMARWTRRLKRSFHAFEKQHARLARLEKRLTQLAR
jgi:hypothetical protein